MFRVWRTVIIIYPILNTNKLTHTHTELQRRKKVFFIQNQILRIGLVIIATTKKSLYNDHVSVGVWVVVILKIKNNNKSLRIKVLLLFYFSEIEKMFWKNKTRELSLLFVSVCVYERLWLIHIVFLNKR